MGGGKVNSDKTVRTFLMMKDIAGPSTYHHEVGAVELLGWRNEFNVPTQLTNQDGNAQSAGKAIHRDMVIRKENDMATVKLLQKCWQGSQIAEMYIAVYNADVCFLKIDLKKVIISNMDVEDATNLRAPEEVIHLHYGYIEYTHTSVNSAGAPQGQVNVAHDLTSDRVDA